VLAQAEKLGVSSRLLSPGAIADARRYLAAFDALALTSRTEGTPMVLLEAMSASVPVVTTMVGGVPDVVSEAEAFCCAAEDIDALACAFGQVVVGGAAVEDRRHRARALVERNYGVEPWLDAHEQLYQRAVDIRSSAR
jgi:glycosyltransferase involved in cell wall biosynthesis